MSNGQKELRSEQQQFWQMAIEIWQSSGLSIRQFCKQEGLSKSAFYSWCKKITKANKLVSGKTKDSMINNDKES